MTELRAGVARAAHAEDALLIEGPPGSGKTLTAHVVHYCGSRPGRALSFDCGARSPESCLVDLLGQVRSAQPGLPADRPGILHAAHHGTLILEEVGDLPIDAQQAILTLIADGAVMRRGAVRAEPLEVRVLATSSIDLEERVDQGRFVPALYQCLRARSLSLPPLADRIEDLPILIQSFLQRWSRVPHQQIFDAVQSVFESYSWPGNVRELESAIERGCQQALDGPLDVHHLPPALRAHAEQARSAVLVPSRRRERLGQTASMDRLALASESGDDHPVSLKNFEKMALVKALQLTQGDKLAAARHLKIGKSTLYRKLQEHGLR
jgi:two-component system response regulator HydG